MFFHALQFNLFRSKLTDFGEKYESKTKEKRGCHEVYTCTYLMCLQKVVTFGVTTFPELNQENI